MNTIDEDIKSINDLFLFYDIRAQQNRHKISMTHV